MSQRTTIRFLKITVSSSLSKKDSWRLVVQSTWNLLMPARDPGLVLHLPTRWEKGAAAAAVPAAPAAAADSSRTLITAKGAQGLHGAFFP